MTFDIDIKRDVEYALRRTPRLGSAGIKVAVKNRIVTLTGRVENYAQKRRAEQSVMRVAGVIGFANDLALRAPAAGPRLDSDIGIDVVATIKQQFPFSWASIRTMIKNGCVTLEGEVGHVYARDCVERAIWQLSGVRRVNNMLALRPLMADAKDNGKRKQAPTPNLNAAADPVTAETAGDEVDLGIAVASCTGKNARTAGLTGATQNRRCQRIERDSSWVAKR